MHTRHFSDSHFYIGAAHLHFRTNLGSFLSHVSTLTRDIDIEIPSVRLSVCLSVCPFVTVGYSMKTA